MMPSYTPPSSPAISEISVGSPSPPPRKQFHTLIKQSFLPIHRRLKTNGNYETQERCISPRTMSKSNGERVKSFSIADILGHESKNQENNEKQLLQPNQPILPRCDFQHEEQPTKIVRPWDHLRGPIPVRPFLPPALLHYEHRLALDYQRQLQEHFHAQAQLLRQMTMEIIPSESGSERSSSVASDRCSPEPGIRLNASEGQLNRQHSHQTKTKDCDISRVANSTANVQKTQPSGTPLDALFQMATKDFNDSQDQSHLDLFSTRPTPKKKRKSRTAFTNHQIFELEKRFLYQKYLSPADRDEIAGGLGLSNSQVITWFQNRRAKLKRDMEELKKDVESVNALSAHKSFLENVNDLSILKRSPITTYHERSSDASESSLSNGNDIVSPKNETTADHFKNDDLDV